MIQDILVSYGEGVLVECEVCVGIFSYLWGIVKWFFWQIKFEFESNGKFKEWFLDIFWDNLQKQLFKWSEDDGIVVWCKSNFVEVIVEVWGVVDGQFIGKYFLLLVYDDVVVFESVIMLDMFVKMSDMLVLSYVLGVDGGVV